jgi:cytochrome b involved in lipid metabolism
MNKKVYLLIGLIVIVIVLGGALYYLNSNKNKSTQNIENTKIESIPGEINEQVVTSSEETSTNVETTTETEGTSESEEKYYTIEEVQKHNSRESCWTVIRGDVYDLTAWINKHPGGADKILNICGKDGASAFERKHGGEEKPEKALEQFEIGKLKQ